MIGLIVMLRWFLLAALIVGICLAERVAQTRTRPRPRQATPREHAALVARADEQQAWRLAGDDRGLDGAYPPALIDGVCVDAVAAVVVAQQRAKSRGTQ